MSKILEKILVSGILLFLLPVFLMLYMLVRLDSEGGFLYTQKRMGKNKKPFLIYKIRTMKVGAEKLKKKLVKFNEADGPVFKITDDPRLTKIGKFLSHSGLDELPQFFNILKGEMGLVGPRPLPISEAKKVPKKYHKRFSILPGISSSWVINGSHNLTFQQWMEYDLQDVSNITIKNNLKIFIKSILLIINNVLSQLRRS